MSDYKPYPAPQNKRSGCKVGWYYYADKVDAEKCAEAAGHNARLMLSDGYDFGYCWPGSIESIPADSKSEYAGLYEVTIA